MSFVMTPDATQTCSMNVVSFLQDLVLGIFAGFYEETSFHVDDFDRVRFFRHQVRTHPLQQ